MTDEHPYAAYFQPQTPTILGDDVFTMKSTPFIGDKTFKPGDKVLYLMVEEPINVDFNNINKRLPDLNIKLCIITQRHFDDLQKDYDFSRYITTKKITIPVFTPKIKTIDGWDL